VITNHKTATVADSEDRAGIELQCGHCPSNHARAISSHGASNTLPMIPWRRERGGSAGKAV
jgi:hypothetical protein